MIMITREEIKNLLDCADRVFKETVDKSKVNDTAITFLDKGNNTSYTFRLFDIDMNSKGRCRIYIMLDNNSHDQETLYDNACVFIRFKGIPLYDYTKMNLTNPTLSWLGTNNCFPTRDNKYVIRFSRMGQCYTLNSYMVGDEVFFDYLIAYSSDLFSEGYSVIVYEKPESKDKKVDKIEKTHFKDSVKTFTDFVSDDL